MPYFIERQANYCLEYGFDSIHRNLCYFGIFSRSHPFHHQIPMSFFGDDSDFSHLHRAVETHLGYLDDALLAINRFYFGSLRSATPCLDLISPFNFPEGNTDHHFIILRNFIIDCHQKPD